MQAWYYSAPAKTKTLWSDIDIKEEQNRWHLPNI